MSSNSSEPNKATGQYHSIKGTVVETVSAFASEYRFRAETDVQHVSGRRHHWRRVVEAVWQGRAHGG